MTAEGNRPRPANPDERTEARSGWVNAVSASQEDVDEVMTDLNRISAEIKAEITSLDERMARTGKPVDLSALRQAVTALDQVAPPVEGHRPSE